jgi:hypothetical protein
MLPPEDDVAAPWQLVEHGLGTSPWRMMTASAWWGLHRSTAANRWGWERMMVLGDDSSPVSDGAFAPLTLGTSCWLTRGAMFQRHMILDFILFHKLRIIRGCFNHHTNGPPLCLLFIRQLGILSFIKTGGRCGLCCTFRRQWIHAERKRVLCENGVFVGCKSGERKRVLGENGAFFGCPLGHLWSDESIQPYWKNCSRKD